MLPRVAPSRPRARLRPGRSRAHLRLALAVGAAGIAWPGPARAAPGQPTRLGGVEAQGPATAALTALHHNPAMLGAMAATGVQAAFRTGVDQLWVRRYQIAPDTGAPTGALGARSTLTNPMVGFFAGAVLYLDPIAVGVGLYDLSSQFRLRSAGALRYQLADDPDLAAGRSCLVVGDGRCPPNGGQVEYQQDLTFALAWNTGPLQLGAAVHLPMLYQRFAFDVDQELAGTDPDDPNACLSKEDPACALRVGFKGWTRWLPVGDATPGFDAALTFGVGLRLPGRRVTLGARYRTFPLRRRGKVVLSGVGLVCRPEPRDPDVATGDVPSCADAAPTLATLSERLPQEVALGGAFILGRARLWRLDANLYWSDRCVGGLRAASCPDGGGQTLSLVGLAQRQGIEPEQPRYRGRQDLYGVDLYATYQVRARAAVTFAGHFASPATRPDALSPADSEGWRLGASLGTILRVGQSDLALVPGYGIDLWLPQDVGPSQARFEPTARTSFEAAGGDLNAPGARAVLEGRARSTNAGRYFGMLHTFTLALRWTDRDPDER